MASPNAARVGVGAASVTGAIFVAPTTTPLPTDATTALFGYTCIGYTSSDGVQVSESSSITNIRAWEGLSIVYNAQTDYTQEAHFTAIQIDADALKLIFGDSNVTVDGSGNIHIEHVAGIPEPKHCVIEMVPRDGIVQRICMIAQPTSRDSVTYNGRDVAGRGVTFTCIADSNGVTMHEYIAFTSAAAQYPVTLSALAVGLLELVPPFSPNVTAYAATTTNASDDVFAITTDSAATVAIDLNNGTTVTNGAAATWTSGTNTLEITVTNGAETGVYTVTVEA